MDGICDEFKFEELDYFFDGATKQQATLQAPGSVSKFFFYTQTATHYHFTQTAKYFQKLNENFRRMEKEVKRMDPNSPGYENMQKHYLKAKQRLIVYKLIMDCKERNILVHKLFNQFLTMILSNFGFGNIPAPEDLRNSKGQTSLKKVPTQFILDICQYHNMLMNMNQDYFKTTPPQFFDLYFKFLQVVLSDSSMVTNPSERSEMIDLLFFWGQVDKNFTQSMVKAKVIDRENFVKGALTHFGDVGTADFGEEVFYTKWRYRLGVSELMNALWEDPLYKQATRNVKNSDSFSKFIIHLIQDLNYCMDEGFEKIPEYKELLMKSNPTKEDQEKIASDKRNIKSNFDLGKHSLRMIMRVCDFLPEAFAVDECKNTFAMCLNYFAARLSTKNYQSYKFDGIESHGQKPLEMIKNLIMIYINITSQDSLLEEIVNDGRSYTDGLIMDLGKTAFKKKLLETHQFESLQVLIKRLGSLQVKAQNWNKIEELAPDNFMCEMMSTLMNDPVKLPLGGQVMDRATVKKLILSNGPKDPFSNTPLAMEDLVEMPELKKQITDWVDQKLFELGEPVLGNTINFEDEEGAMMEESVFNDEEGELTNTGIRFDINDHLN